MNHKNSFFFIGHFMKKQTNLHSLWDTGLITHRLEDFHSDVSLYYEHIAQVMHDQTLVDNDNNIEQWIKENIEFVCSQIYVDENNATMNASVDFTLGDLYYQRSIPVIEQRLAHGGRRLGALLNLLAKKRPHKKEKLCSGTIALIAVLGAECILAIVAGIIIWHRCKNKSAPAVSYSFSPRKT
jgi:hypothetical protein